MVSPFLPLTEQDVVSPFLYGRRKEWYRYSFPNGAGSGIATIVVPDQDMTAKTCDGPEKGTAENHDG
jgi:hypothetical protein